MEKKKRERERRRNTVFEQLQRSSMIYQGLRTRNERLPSFHLGASQVALVVKNLPAIAGGIRDMGRTSGSRRSPGRGNCSPFQDSCQKNSTDRGAWLVYGVAKSRTRLSTHTSMHSTRRSCVTSSRAIIHSSQY